MKRKLMLFLFVTAAVLLSCSAAYGLDVDVSGKNVPFTDETGYPFIDENNRTMVPLRVTMEQAGGKVDWNPKAQIATVTYDDTAIAVPIGQNYIEKDGVKIPNDTAAVIRDGRTYLPIRAVLESAGFRVYWDAPAKTVMAAPAGQVTSVYDRYRTSAEMINAASSAAMRLDMDVNMDMPGLGAMNMAMKGTIKQIFQHAGDLEMEYVTTTDVRVAGAVESVQASFWYKDGYYYTNMAGTKSKVKMDMTKALEETASPNVDFDASDVKIAYANGNTLTLVLDGASVSRLIDQKTLGAVAGNVGNITSTDIRVTITLDQDGAWKTMSMNFGVTMVVDGLPVSADYVIDMDVTQVGDVQIAFPTDLAGYPEVTQ